MIDTRDEDLAALLDESVGGIESSPEERLGSIRRRGSRRRAVRWTAIGTALAASLGAFAWAGLELRKEAPPVADGTGKPADWKEYTEHWLGLSFRHPEDWQVLPVEVHCRLSFQGVLVSNQRIDLREQWIAFGPSACSGSVPSIDPERLPDDLVIVALTRWAGGPVQAPTDEHDQPDTEFPVSLSDAREGMLGFWPNNHWPIGLDVRTIKMQVGGDDRYAVRLFTAPGASLESVAVADRIVSSIGPMDVCDFAPRGEPGLLTCEQAISGLLLDDKRIVRARLDWYRPRPGTDQFRVWVFVTEPQPASISGSALACYQDLVEILIDARTAHYVTSRQLTRALPCPAP